MKTNIKKQSIGKADNIVCGIIMPISPIDGCSADHWKEVLLIIKDAIKSANFEPSLVSDSDDVGIIQKRIIHNLYSNPFVVCDVSGKNPNVMFELGLRLAFDKPTLIIKDDVTSYSFDTSPIEHLEYPRDLRYQKINDFKDSLKEKIIATYKKSISDPHYSSFLKQFGDIKVAQLNEKEVTTENFLLQSFDDLRNELKQIVSRQLKSKDETISNRFNSIEEYKILEDSFKRISESKSKEGQPEEYNTKIEMAEAIKRLLREEGIQIPFSSIMNFIDHKL